MWTAGPEREGLASHTVAPAAAPVTSRGTPFPQDGGRPIRLLTSSGVLPPSVLLTPNPPRVQAPPYVGPRASTRREPVTNGEFVRPSRQATSSDKMAAAYPRLTRPSDPGLADYKRRRRPGPSNPSPWSSAAGDARGRRRSPGSRTARASRQTPWRPPRRSLVAPGSPQSHPEPESEPLSRLLRG